jgi:hypothetical protein
MFAACMDHRGFISFIALFVVIVIGVISGPGCANIIPPTGGPRDSLPPFLEKATPGDSTRNFRGNKIVFTFNEFIEVQNASQQLMVSPQPAVLPAVDYKLNTLTVRIKDSLEPNTTYTLNFGESIKDFTEGNLLKNFTYTFSTGNYIDSLELRGKVILAETGKIDTTLVVMLHVNPDDSAVVKERPRYVARLDGKGNFVFKNLPPKTFYLYALKDDGGTRRYFDEKQLFAFADKPVITDGKNEPVTLYAYSSKKTVQAIIPSLKGNRNRSNKAEDQRLKYQTNLALRQQDLQKDLIITFDEPLRSFDSTKIRLYTDSLFVPAIGYRFEKDSTNKIVTLYHSWKENTSYHLIMDKDFAEDSAGRKLLKTDTLDFKTKKLADYGSLKLKLKNVDLAQNPVLLLMTGETIYRSYALTGNELAEPMLPPADYELRILYDLNKNGKWDPGEFFGKHKQPEIVKPIDKKIAVKPAFQNEFEITL